MEPWDELAAIVFSDGDKMVAVLDRNGLRPARYYIQHPYDEWLNEGVVTLDSLYESKSEEVGRERRENLLKAFGYSYEDLTDTILPMMEIGEEPLGSMGIDTPLTVFSKREQPLFNYFKQLFAQVTNTPIDAIREEGVPSTNVYLGTDCVATALRQGAKSIIQLEITDKVPKCRMVKIRRWKSSFNKYRK